MLRRFMFPFLCLSLFLSLSVSLVGGLLLLPLPPPPPPLLLLLTTTTTAYPTYLHTYIPTYPPHTCIPAYMALYGHVMFM